MASCNRQMANAKATNANIDEGVGNNKYLILSNCEFLKEKGERRIS